ncbi:glycosyltransferase family 4 protein [Methanoculleus sp. FWC-SCC1]|uniref:Glycosyltransferase family 4 protein n=1 Tax=Methanoculleus frigidifontis TaxID=2584085 RepID=A0ABT8MDS5_9EURY|nr:glycosyltransferase family 4 protein [Methanoculleus sp. FWC-SCC1]MDN7026094.1 glycosyltransferase family 4 protein [Methanoculleus sp. FWC-SCC1]
MKRSGIGIITFPLSTSGTTPLSHLVAVMDALSDDLYLITGNEGYKAFRDDSRVTVFGVSHEYTESVLQKIARYVHAQVMMSRAVLKVGRDAGTWVFFIGGEGLVLPMLAAKVVGARTAIGLAGVPSRDPAAGDENLAGSLTLLSSINFRLADAIIVYSERIIADRGLEEYAPKIAVAHEHYLDFDLFCDAKPFEERQTLVGYVGRLSEVKGIFNLIEAIPGVLKERDDVTFVIVGEGPQRGRVEEYLAGYDLAGRVRLPGWVPHADLPGVLGDLKLLVVPSYSEGLPNVVLEAMACGTPVLATPVGSVPDIIRDGETGFLLQDNTPGRIADAILACLARPDLAEVAARGRDAVRGAFTFAEAVRKYRAALAAAEGKH